jgi:hypothetical protein
MGFCIVIINSGIRSSDDRKNFPVVQQIHYPGAISPATPGAHTFSRAGRIKARDHRRTKVYQQFGRLDSFTSLFRKRRCMSRARPEACLGGRRL